jgi:hypothetical protein
MKKETRSSTGFDADLAYREHAPSKQVLRAAAVGSTRPGRQ